MDSGHQGSEEFTENPTLNFKNSRFPTFQQEQNFRKSGHQQNSMSFRKKVGSQTNAHLPLNSMYSSPEFFNFYGVLNFKVKKFNKVLLNEAFGNIYERACEVESRHRMLAFGTIMKKDYFLLQMSRLATEVNRRYNIKNQNLFRITKGLMNKAKICLRMLRMFRTGRQQRHSPMGSNSQYMGKTFLHITISIYKDI